LGLSRSSLRWHFERMAPAAKGATPLYMLSKPARAGRFRSGALLAGGLSLLSHVCLGSLLSFDNALWWLLGQLCQAFFECSHEVNHRRRFARLFDFFDFAAFQTSFDQGLEILFKGVVILFGFERARQSFDQLVCDLHLGVFQLHIRLAESFKVTYL